MHSEKNDDENQCDFGNFGDFFAFLLRSSLFLVTFEILET